ncbi:MAG: 3-deoxy-D-manno-octulosonic acid kinase [Nitrospirota bacterium]|nr:3-deoxy-D-manno-octulosonic acid kinase [Nitrospirota bacterium]
MSPAYQEIGNQHFLYDPTIIKKITPDHFDFKAWHDTGKVLGEARGRGRVLFVRDASYQFVLRHYRRGGFISKFFTDHYIWQGLQQTRAWAEWHLLKLMVEKGLPVPKPVAARVIKHGRTYTADLLTLTLPDCQSLAEHFQKETCTKEILFEAGQTIHHFHHVGIYHADLNAHNILINQTGRIYLLDFDRGRKRQGQAWKKQNLSRLHRSFCKLARENKSATSFAEKWEMLLQGYEKGQNSQAL